MAHNRQRLSGHGLPDPAAAAVDDVGRLCQWGRSSGQLRGDLLALCRRVYG
ncbi:hypothetical protein [Streptomyces armeniacus]|uniref:hypothetical protein n=1 Tax=Streptomyces armeniacus TaxID=83291 RepID=UPI001AD8118F|nr:hypothetical protein [Streptomyces armeniacus]